ncbi:MAG: nitrite reductase (NAD(P)H) small subunit [Gammaproteobacteria bacterium]|nr:MAG: nitrite reductase (NAD(P)H) small subunit [Gammaproteobacteria bacterium]RLA22079.1 MAG: nitrite reductase (NAD(P)H) small subunit [Gammaproteobacteria bacterium]
MSAEMKNESAEWVDICSLDALQPNSGVCALVEGRQIAIFYMPKADKVYAIDNFDPFGEANVLSRGLIGDLKGEPVVASPLYKQHFNLETGQCLEDEAVKIGAYAVRIDAQKVQLAL